MKKIITLLFAAMVSVAMFTACGGAGGQSEIVGTWQDDYGALLEIKQDNTYVYMETYPGTWSGEDGVYSFTASSGGTSVGKIVEDDDGNVYLHTQDIGRVTDTIKNRRWHKE